MKSLYFNSIIDLKMYVVVETKVPPRPSAVSCNISKREFFGEVRKGIKCNN